MSAHPTDAHLDRFGHLPWACEVAAEGGDVADRANGLCRACVIASGAAAVNGTARGGRALRYFYESWRDLHGLPPLPKAAAG